jgi:hypothetical protein
MSSPQPPESTALRAVDSRALRDRLANEKTNACIVVVWLKIEFFNDYSISMINYINLPNASKNIPNYNSKTLKII